MTLSVLDSHSPIASLFKYDFLAFMARRTIPLSLKSFL